MRIAYLVPSLLSAALVAVSLCHAEETSVLSRVVVAPSSNMTEDSEEPFNSAWQREVTAYRKAIRANHNDLHAVQKVAGDFRARMNELRGRVEASDVSQLDSDDLAALAECCELQSDRAACIRYAQFAIEKDQECQRAYLPLLRTLLNENRIDEAVEVLAGGQEVMPTNAGLHGVHAFIYQKAMRMGRHDLAGPHLLKFIEGEIARLPETSAIHGLIQRAPSLAIAGQDGAIDAVLATQRLEQIAARVRKELELLAEGAATEALEPDQRERQIHLYSLLACVSGLLDSPEVVAIHARLLEAACSLLATDSAIPRDFQIAAVGMDTVQASSYWWDDTSELMSTLEEIRGTLHPLVRTQEEEGSSGADPLQDLLTRMESLRDYVTAHQEVATAASEAIGTSCRLIDHETKEPIDLGERNAWVYVPPRGNADYFSALRNMQLQMLRKPSLSDSVAVIVVVADEEKDKIPAISSMFRGARIAKMDGSWPLDGLESRCDAGLLVLLDRNSVPVEVVFGTELPKIEFLTLRTATLNNSYE